MIAKKQKDVEYLKRLGGSSASATYLIRLDGDLRVRKIAAPSGVAKLKFQADWYAQSDLQIKVPRVLSINSSENYYSYDLEYIDESRNLFEELKVNPYQAAEALDSLLTQLGDAFYDDAAYEKRPQSRDFYLRWKMSEKISEAASLSQEFRSCLSEPFFYVNGERFTNFRKAFSLLRTDVSLMRDLATIRPSRLHGDLTLENIIVREQETYLIDPNNDNILNSELVDFGKLLQSLDSRYEFLASATDIEIEPNSVNYKLPIAPNDSAIRSVFIKHFEKRFKSFEKRLVHLHQAVHLARLLPYQLRNRDPRFWLLYGEFLRKLNESLGLT